MKPRRKGLKRLVGNEHGKVLILALIFLVLGALLLTPLLGLMSTGLTAGRVYENRAHSLYAADAGVEDAVNWLLEDRPMDDWPWTGGDDPWQRTQELEINHHNVNVTIEVDGPPDDNRYMITSESEAINGDGGTKVIALVMVQPRSKCQVLTGDQTFSNSPGQGVPQEVDIIVIGTVTIQHNQTVDGSMTIDGDLIMGNKAVINGDSLCVSGTVEMNQGGTEINADLLVGEDLVFNQPSEVNGNVFIYGDIRFLSNATINGNVYAYNDIYIRVDASNPINGNIYADGNVHIEILTNAHIYGDVYANGDITITLGQGTPQAKIHGTLYSTGTVTVTPSNRSETISLGKTTIDESQFPAYPDEPDCPMVDPQGTVVDTYQIEGYGG